MDLELWDTAGQDEYDTIRQLSYQSTDVVVICFNVVDRRTLEDVGHKWQVEVRKFAGPQTPVILVGNQVDRRRPADNKQQVIMFSYWLSQRLTITEAGCSEVTDT